MPNPGRAQQSLHVHSNQLTSQSHGRSTRTLDEHQQLVYDGLGQRLAVERVKQYAPRGRRLSVFVEATCRSEAGGRHLLGREVAACVR